jgi:aspartate/methionine/tyrosine aminotransferase
MSVKRLADIAGFSIDRVAAAAGADPDVLRLENLDTDVLPPREAIEATQAAMETPEGNSWLPFTGRDDLKQAVVERIVARGGPRYDARQVVITCGEGDAMLDTLFCTTDPGDEVILTDPTYAGMLNRVRLAGAVPRLVPLVVENDEWRLDVDALRAAASDRTRAVFINNASFPSGWAATSDELEAIASVCRERDAWLIYWNGYEGVLFDGRTPVLPSALDGMRDRTVTIGSPTLEQRMIGWRIGWIVAPGELVDDVGTVHIYNGLVPSGFNQVGARVALTTPDDGLAAANAEWQARRDETMRQLEGLPAVKASGGWSLLLDCAAIGIEAAELSQRLLDQKVAATPMTGWGGPVADRHLRFVYSREPVERLALLAERLRAVLG